MARAIWYTAASMFSGRWNWLILAFAAPIVLILLHQLFATAWSNKCDPGNTQFYLMKSDPIVSFHPQGELFMWENDGPDNSWLCSDASLSVSHVGANVNAMFEATRADMTSSGWTGGEIFLKDQDFAVYEKVKEGVTLNAVVRKQALWVEVDMNAPGLHPGDYGFGG